MSQPIQIHRFVGLRFCVLALALLAGLAARSQDAVNYLRTAGDRTEGLDAKLRMAATEQRFDFSKNLICFTASVNGRAGSYILDTGAPHLLLNDWGQAERPARAEGLAAGGRVTLGERYVASLRFSGREYAKLWASTLDLRPMEKHLGQAIDGYIGFELLQRSEVRIDYQRQNFRLLPPRRRPTHLGRAPDHVLSFKLVGHMPLVKVRQGKQNYYLLVDTGASLNLLDESLAGLLAHTAGKVHVRGLDGHGIVARRGPLADASILPVSTKEAEFALLNLQALQPEEGSLPIHGILGSAYLSEFVIGIDYPRRKIYLWKPQPSK